MPQIPFAHYEIIDISYDRQGRQSPAIELDAGRPDHINVIDRSHSEHIPITIGGNAIRRTTIMGAEK